MTAHYAFQRRASTGLGAPSQGAFAAMFLLLPIGLSVAGAALGSRARCGAGGLVGAGVGAAILPAAALLFANR